jgi:hypothetical protein
MTAMRAPNIIGAQTVRTNAYRRCRPSTLMSNDTADAECLERAYPTFSASRLLGDRIYFAGSAACSAKTA